MAASQESGRAFRCSFFAAACLAWFSGPVRADLLLFYDFNDASDAETAVDQGGAGNDGLIGVAVYTEDGRGRSGQPGDRAIDFLSGTEGAYIDVTTAIDDAFQTMVDNDSATVALWVFGGDFQPQNHFAFWFAEGEVDPRQFSAHIPWSDATIYFDVSGCCDATQRSNQSEPDDTKWKGAWNHYAFVKDQQITRIYQNGELWLEGDGKAPLSAIHTVRFGTGGGTLGNLSYNGLMDDIGVWDEALDQDQIQSVMENGTIKSPVPKMAATPDQGSSPLAVSFDATGSTTPEGTIESYSWLFGDGGTGSGLQVQHTYAHAGVFKARLTVKDSRGAKGSLSKEIAVTFGCGNVAPEYVSADVGSPKVAGCARHEGEDYVVFGGGKDIRLRSDQFQFVYKDEPGDVTLTAQIRDVTLTNPFLGRAGLMLRDSTATDAAFGFIHIQASQGGFRAALLSRPAQGFPAVVKSSAEFLVPPDVWLRLERKGAELIGSASIDGTVFTEVSRATLTAPLASMLGGMAVTSVDISERGMTVEATMRLGGNAPGGTVFHRGDTDSNGRLELTDAVRLLGLLFLGTGQITCKDSADADDNGRLELTDAVRILGVLFLGTGTIAPPGPPTSACGIDPTPADAGTDLGCDAYTGC